MTAFLMYRKVKIAFSSLIRSLMSSLRNLLQRLVDELRSAVVGVDQSAIQLEIALVDGYNFMYLVS